MVDFINVSYTYFIKTLLESCKLLHKIMIQICNCKHAIVLMNKDLKGSV